MSKIFIKKFVVGIVSFFILSLSNQTFANESAKSSSDYFHIKNIDSLLTISYGFLEQKDFQNSLLILKHAYEISQETKNEEKSVEVLKHMGNVFDEASDYKNAMHFYFSSLEKAEKLGLTNQIASLHINIGVTYFNMQEPQEALNQYQSAIEIAKTSNDTLTIIKALNNIGNVYMSLYQDAEKSVSFFEKSALLSKQIGYTAGIYTNMGNLAQIHLFLGNINSAEKAVDELMALDSTDAYTLFTLANLYRAKKMPHETIKAMENTLNYCQNLVELEQIILKDISDLYAEIGNYQKSLEYFKKYSELKETIHDTESKKYVMELQKKYQTEKREAQIKQLESEKKQSKIINTFLVISLFFIFGIALLIYMNYRRKVVIIKQQESINKQKLHELEQEKIILASAATIKGEETERIRIARDIHDGLGGLLSGLKLALLNVKTKNGLDEAQSSNVDYAMDFLNKSVDEMHKIAYNMMPETLHKFGLHEAFDTFCNSLKGQNKEVNIVYQFFGQDQRFSKMFELNVYRIGQEMLNNAIKYSEGKNIVAELVIESDRLFLSVTDDGVGFDLTTIKSESSGLGMKNISSRTEAFGGVIDINTEIGNGTEMMVEFRNINQNKYIYDQNYYC